MNCERITHLERILDMKSRVLLTALTVLALIAATSLRAAEEKKDKLKDVKCPVSGKAVKAESTVEYNGGKVYFCCNNCPKAFSADTEKYKAKANHQLAQTEQLEEVACPITNNKFKKETELDVAGVRVAFCCNNCKGSIEKLKTDDDKINKLFTDVSKSYKKTEKK
jgi:YHS domain-containing protein